jgi:hypothetical protein
MKASTAVLTVLVALIALACGHGSSTRPSPTDLTAVWAGTSTYPNAPFQLSLNQDGATLRGQYSDALDRSLAVTGTVISPTFTVVVDFGDAKLNLQGRMLDARTAQGVMFTSALGNREYPFTMTR